MPRSTDPAPTDLLRIDDELADEERLVRDTVRKYTGDRILPNVADWFEAGTVPKELFAELGALGVLGMHLTGLRLRGDVGDRLRGGVPGARGGRLGPAQHGVGAGIAGNVPDLEIRQRTSRKTNGCRGWPRARPSAASG